MRFNQKIFQFQFLFFGVSREINYFNQLVYQYYWINIIQTNYLQNYSKIKMKKVPSNTKITANTNITAMQAHKININSPKATFVNKRLKNDMKKQQFRAQIRKNISEVCLFKSEIKKRVQTVSKQRKKIIKQPFSFINQKSIKISKSQKQLSILSQKIMELQTKIKKIRQKQKIQKNQASTHRTASKRYQTSYFSKRQASSQKKQIHIVNIYEKQKIDNNRIIKKTFSDKIQAQKNPQKVSKNKRIEKIKKGKTKTEQNGNSKLKKQKHNYQILHKFVKVSNKHRDYLQQSILNFLTKNNSFYVVTPSISSINSQFQQQQSQQYYISKAIKSLNNPSLFHIRQHLCQSLQILQYLKNIKKPSWKQIDKKQINLPYTKFTYTVILDLDETLIHCNQSIEIPHDVKLSLKFPKGQKVDVGINIRPYAKKFIQKLSKICQVIIFTASHQCYATEVLDYLDPKKQYIKHRLFRQDCWLTQQGIYIKDLRIIKNRIIDNILLVDNAVYSYYYQIQNGIPIIPYYDNKQDNQLIILLNYIKEKIKICQINKQMLTFVNREYFKLQQYTKYQDIRLLVEELYGGNYKIYK